MSQSASSLSCLIWSVADLRGDYEPSEYGQVMLPFTILRRLDRVLRMHTIVHGVRGWCFLVRARREPITPSSSGSCGFSAYPRLAH
jgi:HsdM N-terminal domain